MRYFGDMSVSEMAEALAVPEGTVKFRLSEGRRRIREFLSQRKIEITR
jgi:DNA-directed RNA polymerase specialized sigma24 family protein